MDHLHGIPEFRQPAHRPRSLRLWLDRGRAAGMSSQPAPGAPRTSEFETLTAALRLDGCVSICWRIPPGDFRGRVVHVTNASPLIDRYKADSDLYFGVNPL